MSLDDRVRRGIVRLRERFAVEHGLPPLMVHGFARWGMRRARFLTNECNGEPRHPKATSDDKSENAGLWGADAEVLGSRMSELAAKWGYAVEFGVGFYPVLRKGESWVHFPWD